MSSSKVIVPYLLCAVGFLLATYWFYPGYASYDTVVQFLQAKHFEFSTNHPPVMAFLWHYLLILTPARIGFTFPMFLLQMLMLWLALTLWVYMLSKKYGRYLWLIPLVGLFPNIIILNAFVWKDIQMGNSLFLALTLLALIQGGIRAKWLKMLLVTLMVLLVLYAFCLRHEALLLCLPIFYLWARCLGAHKLFSKGLLTLGFFLTFSGFAWLFQTMLSTHEDYPVQTVMFYDLASLSIKENHMLIPLDDCNDSRTCFEDVRKDYDPTSVMTILTDFVTGAPSPAWLSEFKNPYLDFRPLQWTYSAENYQQLKTAWLHAIAAHPGLYLQERAIFFAGALSYIPFFYGIKLGALSNPGFYHVMPVNIVVHLLFSLYTLLSVVFAFGFVGWFWLGLNIVMLVFLQAKEDQYPFYAVVKVMLLSGLILCLSHFIVAAATDFRYFYWTMLATLFSFMVLFINENGNVSLGLPKVP